MYKVIFREKIIASNENDMKLLTIKFNLIKINNDNLKTIFLINYDIKSQNCL